MGDSEFGTCSFCHQEKHVGRKYIRPTKHQKPEDIVEACKLYNEGNYFIIVWYCNDCGEPKVT